MATVATSHAGTSARLAYARSPGASSCPDESTLKTAVAARLGYDPFFAWAKRTVVVQVWHEGGRYMARLQIVDDRGFSHGTRELSSKGRDCTELFDTVALAISIAMDEMPKDEPSPTLPGGPAPGQGEAQSTPAPAPVAAAPPAPPAPTEPSLESSPTPRAAPPPAGALFAAGVDVVGSRDAAPSVAAGVSAVFALRWRAASASLELRADAPASADNAAGAGRVTSSSYVAALAPCAHYRGAFLCTLGLLGILHAQGSGVTNPRSGSMLVAAAGGRLGYEWPLSPRISLRAHVDLVVDLRRATFLIDERGAWTAPPLAEAAGLGLLVYFE
jgi:hypothetical protein